MVPSDPSLVRIPTATGTGSDTGHRHARRDAVCRGGQTTVETELGPATDRWRSEGASERLTGRIVRSARIQRYAGNEDRLGASVEESL
jgi:hypothetical protein